MARADLVERARQVDEIRRGLSHPSGAIRVHEGGFIFEKPPYPRITNVESVLKRDPEYRHAPRLNLFSGRVEWMGTPLCDTVITTVRLELERDYHLRSTPSDLHSVINVLAASQAYHPIRDYLAGLRWDGRPRLSELFSKYAGAEAAHPLVGVFGSKFMISAVARVMEPGCQVDTMVVLQGPQGLGKSSFFRVLASSPWFRDDPIDIRHKDASMALEGVWIYEMAELSSIRVRDAESNKAFLSRRIESFRRPYERTVTQSPRQNVFCGTTNEMAFLSDPTGARRFWAVTVRREPDLSALKADRDQLWAEAVELYHEGHPWHLSLAQSRALVDYQAIFQHEDPWLSRIAIWAAGEDELTIPRILDKCIEKPKERQTKGDQLRIGGLLHFLGYEKTRSQVNGVRATRWEKRHTCHYSATPSAEVVAPLKSDE